MRKRYLLLLQLDGEGEMPDASAAIEATKTALRLKLTELKDWARPVPSNSVQLMWYNGNFGADSMDLENLIGPKTAMTPILNPSATYNIENTRTAYIMSSRPEASPLAQGFKKGNYTESVSDTTNPEVTQKALWNDETFNEGQILAGSALYTEAVDYEKFYNSQLANYKLVIDGSNAQVISNRGDGTHTIGPYTATYPDDTRFSYLEDLYVVTNLSSKVEPLEIIFGSKSGKKPYPSSGEPFFVKFSAQGDPTTAGIHVDGAYIETSKATYEKLEGKGDIYQFYGEIKKKVLSGYDQPTWEMWGEIKLRKIGEYIAQKAGHRTYDERRWKRVSVETQISIGGGGSGSENPGNPSEGTPPPPITLTMDLGGYVWVDADGGKESMPNGLYNDEERVSNVTVTLYKEGGELIATTKTDANGEYRFTGIKAMYQYYVKFTYNGQYYQPTTYASSNTWFDPNWQINSNATDKVNERLAFNAKFASIGSSPENYVGGAGPNKSYTRDELYAAGAIDEFGNPTGGGNASMAQYANDCLIDAYTGAGDGSYDVYPVPGHITHDTFQYPSMYTPKTDELYPNAYYINLGLNPRRDSDLAIKKDVDHVDLEINGQTHRYTYDTLENKPDAEGAWDISVRLSDAYYNTNYSREIYKSDYIYKSSMYDDEDTNNDGIGDVYGKDKEDELQVYITYKIMIRNQALSIQSKVDEIVDFYDQDLEYIDNRSYIKISRGDNAGTYSVKASANSRYSGNTRTSISGYDNLYITGLDDKYLTAGQTAYVYLTFRVKKDRIDGEDWVKLDEEIVSGNAIGVGKENIVEINGYTTRYAPGTEVPNVGDVSLTPAGILDRDSNPGNLSPSDVPKDGSSNYGNFEDDTDKAPNIRLILYRNDDANRVISGSIWEDARTESIEVTTTGDGIRDDKETLINGVTVQLVELMENGTEYIWREFGAPATTLAEGIGRSKYSRKRNRFRNNCIRNTNYKLQRHSRKL